MSFIFPRCLIPADTTHPDYDENVDSWMKCRHFTGGSKDVKGQAVKYLPKLEGQEPDEYQAFKARAFFYPAAHRTVQGLAGAVMRKPPQVEFPDEEQLENLGCGSESFTELVNATLEEVLSTGRLGGYVDAEEDNAVPYIALYNPENVINWRTAEIDGREQLILVCLKEKIADLDDKDEFKVKPCEQIRVLRLADVDTKPTYTVQVYTKRKSDQDKPGPKSPRGNSPSTLYGTKPKDGSEDDRVVNGDWTPGEVITPKMAGGKPFDFIPFRFCGPMGTTEEVQKSPILDLVDVNHSHYLTSADLEHGAHFTALPTAYAFGFDPVTTKLHIGSSRAWISTNEQAKAGFLEFSGTGLGFLATLLEKKESKMAVLGARLLEEQKDGGPESGVALSLRHAGGLSVLANVASSVSKFFQTLLGWVAQWQGRSEAEIRVTLNTDFGAANVDAPLLGQLMLALQGGTLSYEMWFHNLKRGQIIPEDRTLEDEKAGIEEGMPVAKPQPGEELDQHGLPKDPTDPEHVAKAKAVADKQKTDLEVQAQAAAAAAKGT